MDKKDKPKQNGMFVDKCVYLYVYIYISIYIYILYVFRVFDTSDLYKNIYNIFIYIIY